MEISKLLKNLGFAKFARSKNVRSYEGAEHKNTDANWTGYVTSEDEDIYSSLSSLKGRSREFAQNNPIMKKYLHLMDSNVIGKDGFKLRVQGKERNDMLDFVGNQAVERAWNDWTKASNCDIYNKSDFKTQQSIMLKTLIKDGEILIRFIREKSQKGNKYGFKIQLLDTMRLDINYNRNLEDRYIRMGVEFDQYGSPVAYYLKKHLGGSLAEGVRDYSHERVLASDLLHVFNAENPEQSRGTPWASSVMVYMRELNEFNKTCLVAAKVGAASSIYLEREQGASISGIADGKNEQGDFYATMGAGKILTLPKGLKMQSFKGEYPAATYQIYTKRMMMLIAGGLGLSSVSLGDYEGLNFSTSKFVYSEDTNMYKSVQNFFVNNVLNRIFVEFLEQALLNKQIKVGDFGHIGADKLEKFSNFKFLGRTFEGLDAKKDEETKLLKFKNLRLPISTMLSNEGLDIVDVMNSYKQDEEIIKKITGEDFSVLKHLFNISDEKEKSFSVQHEENQEDEEK